MSGMQYQTCKQIRDILVKTVEFGTGDKAICLVTPIIGHVMMAEVEYTGDTLKLSRIVTMQIQPNLRTGQMEQAMSGESLGFGFPEFIRPEEIRRIIPVTDENLGCPVGSHLRRLRENYD